MSVDDAVRIIITSGIATERPAAGDYRDLTDDELAQVGGLARGEVDARGSAGDDGDADVGDTGGTVDDDGDGPG